MSKKISNTQQIWDCRESCMSVTHGNMISAAVQMKSLTDEQVAIFIHSTCRNFAKVLDGCGRTALHVAASCGRTGLCSWLISAGSDLNCKDLESGSTPLHRSIYHSHLNIAVKLMEHGSDLNLMNNEGLTPLNMLSIDLVRHICLLSSMPCQVYIWGTNFNYTLGTGTDESKKTPECLEFFKKNFSSVKQVAMDKFHTVFLTTYNTVWVCGHGKGGRLGLGNENSLLIPTKMLSKGEPCERIAVSINHTLVLLSNGSVLSSGSNCYYQLGTTPYGVSTNLLKNVDLYSAKLSSHISKIAAAKYHSVFYNKKNIVVCGLNAGQLGPKNKSDICIMVPSQLNVQLRDQSTYISEVATSNGCIVYALSTGDIYMIHQYQFKKIATKKSISSLTCFGGILDSDVINDNKEDLKVAFLDKTGSVYLWQMDVMLKCEYGIGRSLHVSTIHLNSKGILIVTHRGEAYSASQKQSTLPSTESIQMEITKIPNVHRAINITSDPEGNNFAVIQTHPTNSLKEVPEVKKRYFFTGLKTLMAETTEDDTLHDLIINTRGHIFPVHRYILATRGCEYAFHEEKILNLDIEPIIIKEILYYIYIGEFEFIDDPNNDIFKIVDGLKLLQETAKHVKDDKLHLRIKSLTYSSSNFINLLDDYPLFIDDIKFNRNLFPEFYDVELISEEGTVFHAHKVVLASSLEYFRNMFLHGWSERKTKTKINFSGSTNTLDLFLLYIYTNKVCEQVNSIDLDGVIKLLKVADQYLAENLKEKCEFILCTLLSLRNCVTLLQVSSTYNAYQLKKSCVHFICLNFNAFLESRQLENIEDELLKDIADYYKTRMTQIREMPECESSYSQDISNFFINHSGDTEMPKLMSPDVKHPKGINIPKKKTPKKLSLTPTSPPQHFINRIDFNIKDIEENDDQILFGSPNYNEDFPSMSSYISSPPKSYGKNKCIPMVKVPQKERKSMPKSEETLNTSPKLGKAWEIIPPIHNIELVFPKSLEESNLKAIIEFEKQKKTNWFKMKTKPFHLTQMEDTAMEGLKDFYNASGVFDEKITVQRVLTTDIAQPMWIPSHTLPIL